MRIEILGLTEWKEMSLDELCEANKGSLTKEQIIDELNHLLEKGSLSVRVVSKKSFYMLKEDKKINIII